MVANSGDDQLMSEINVTPFVDVMLVLLIIFMVTAPMLVQGVNVSLPQAQTSSLQSDKDHLVISINKNNQIFINELQVQFDFLYDKLSKIRLGRTKQALYLKADKDVPYGMVVMVMAKAKAAGFEKLGMITLPPEELP